MLDVLTFIGVVLIGFGVAAQGWFILDLNQRITHLFSTLFKEQQKED